VSVRPGIAIAVAQEVAKVHHPILLGLNKLAYKGDLSLIRLTGFRVDYCELRGVDALSRKLRLIRRLQRHLAKHPNDKNAREILQALLEGRYRWKGRSLVILPKEETEAKASEGKS